MAKWADIRKKLMSNPEFEKEYSKLPSVDIAAQLINARKEKGFTQAELAKLAGTSQSAISRLENGDYLGYTFKTLSKIANALDAKLDITFKPKQKIRKIEVETGKTKMIR